MIERIAAELLAPADAMTMRAHGRDAAVLMPFRVHDDGAIRLVFTKRHDDLPQHAGQISFPGGAVDADDADLVATALREAHEELAIPPGVVEVIGALEPMSTFVSDFAVYPIAGVVPAAQALVPNPSEVERWFEVELAELRRLRERKQISRGGITFTTESYDTAGGVIWGVTGYILGRLLDRIAGCFDR